VYYSDSLIKVNPGKDAVKDKVYYEQNFVEPIDIGYFPDIIGDITNRDLECLKSNIQNFIRWLSSDTLVVWNWIFD
jgi:hypothetical protein